MIINGIDTNDISVVVQGAIDQINTPKCLRSIRKRLPGAEIILSTWEGSPIDELDYDKLVLNKDPGSFFMNNTHSAYNNVNRQIVSTYAGLKKSDRKFAIKIRSDMELTGHGFLEYFDRYPCRNKQYAIFNKRIIINNKYCVNPELLGMPFHISDWFMFGLREDVLKLWDIPLQNEKNARYFESRKAPADGIQLDVLYRWAPEQYIWKSCIEKNGHTLSFNYYGDVHNNNIQLSILYLINNFTVIDYERSSLTFLKYNAETHDFSKQETHNNWLLNYKKYCDAEYVLSKPHATPKMSVIVPTHGRIDYFKETMTCLLNQNSDEFEVIITDDSAKEEERKEIEAIVKRYQEIGCNFRYVFSKPNLLQAPNTNQGLSLAKGKYIRILHSDDLISHNCIAKEIKTFEENPEIDFFYHHIIAFWFKDHQLADYYQNKPVKNSELIFRNQNIQPEIIDPYLCWIQNIFTATAVPSSIVFKKELLQRAGMMKENYKFLCDWDLFYRFILDAILHNKKTAFIDKGYVGWRFGGESVSKNLFLNHFYEHEDFIKRITGELNSLKLLDKKTLRKCVFQALKYRMQKLHSDFIKKTNLKQKISLLPVMLKLYCSRLPLFLDMVLSIIFIPFKIISFVVEKIFIPLFVSPQATKEKIYNKLLKHIAKKQI